MLTRSIERSARCLLNHANIYLMEEDRPPVGRPDFKSGKGCQQSLVGSTPTLFRHHRLSILASCGNPPCPRLISRHREARDSTACTVRG